MDRLGIEALRVDWLEARSQREDEAKESMSHEQEYLRAREEANAEARAADRMRRIIEMLIEEMEKHGVPLPESLGSQEERFE